MSPPKWLEDFWKRETNWIKRYMQGSWELNMILSGKDSRVDKKSTMWKPKAIRDFLEFMDKHKKLLKRKTTIYRGTTVLSPSMDSACFEMKTSHFLSCSKSLDIAREFAGKDGFVHVFVCDPGVSVFDFKSIYGNDPVKREKEVLLYPNMQLTFVLQNNDKNKNKKENKNILTWHVKP